MTPAFAPSGKAAARTAAARAVRTRNLFIHRLPQANLTAEDMLKG
jgi:hypothetical protein